MEHHLSLYKSVGKSCIPYRDLSYLADLGQRPGGFGVASGSGRQEGQGQLGVVSHVSAIDVAQHVEKLLTRVDHTQSLGRGQWPLG